MRVWPSKESLKEKARQQVVKRAATPECREKWPREMNRQSCMQLAGGAAGTVAL